MFAEVESERAGFEPLTNLPISFVDRQELKRLEDRVIELRVIVETTQKDVQQLYEHARKVSIHEYFEHDSVMEAILDEFQELVKTAKSNENRAKALKWRAKEVTKLVSHPRSPNEFFPKATLTNL